MKLTSGIWLVLSQHHYFRVRNHERYGNTIQTKKFQTCICGTHLSGKCPHCKRVRWRSNVIYRPETPLSPICDRHCTLLTLRLGEKKNTVSYYEGKRASQLLSSFLLQTVNGSCDCKNCMYIGKNW